MSSTHTHTYAPASINYIHWVMHKLLYRLENEI